MANDQLIPAGLIPQHIINKWPKILGLVGDGGYHQFYTDDFGRVQVQVGRGVVSPEGVIQIHLAAANAILDFAVVNPNLDRLDVSACGVTGLQVDPVYAGQRLRWYALTY